MAIIQWRENLTEEEMPPEWMWDNDEELERHFERIKAKRRRAGPGDDDDDDDQGLTVHNEYARGRGRAR